MGHWQLRNKKSPRINTWALIIAFRDIRAYEVKELNEEYIDLRIGLERQKLVDN